MDRTFKPPGNQPHPGSELREGGLSPFLLINSLLLLCFTGSSAHLQKCDSSFAKVVCGAARRIMLGR